MSAMCSISTRPLARKVLPVCDQIDDLPREAHARRQLHRAVEHDAFGLHAARGEMPPRHLGIFGRDADMAPARGIVAPASSFGAATTRRQRPTFRSSGT